MVHQNYFIIEFDNEWTYDSKESWKLYFSHKSTIISTWYANLHSKYNRKMSELIAICIFLHVRRTSSRPDFFAIKTAFKITKLKIYFLKKESNHFSNNILIQNYPKKKIFLTIFGKMRFVKLVLIWKLNKYDECDNHIRLTPYHCVSNQKCRIFLYSTMYYVNFTK